MSFTQLFLYGQQGLFLDLTEKLPALAPNLQQALKDHPDASKLIVSPDKKIYSFPDFNDCYHCRASNGRTFLNTEWLQKVGLGCRAPPTSSARC